MNGTLEDKPVLEVQVENEAERGLLGVAILMMTYVIIKRKGLQIIKVNLEFFFILLKNQRTKMGNSSKEIKYLAMDGIDKIIVLLIQN